MSIKDAEAKTKRQELEKKLEKSLDEIFKQMGFNPVLTAEERKKRAAEDIRNYYQGVYDAVYGHGAVTVSVKVSEDGQIEVTEQYNQSLETLSMEVKIC